MIAVTTHLVLVDVEDGKFILDQTFTPHKCVKLFRFTSTAHKKGPKIKSSEDLGGILPHQKMWLPEITSLR